MAIEVSQQSVSSTQVNSTRVQVRQSQGSTQLTETVSVAKSTKTDNNNSIRQQIAAENVQKTDSRQSLADAKSVVTQLNENVQNVNRQLEFRIDEKSGRTIIRVKDRESGKIIREIPSEDIVRIGNRIRDLAESLHGSSKKLAGLLLERQA